MSYEIEYSKHAFQAIDRYNDKVYLAFVETCSNNVSPRTPKPRYFQHGRKYEIIGKACEVGASVESGCWKPNNRWIKPELYIRQWRQVIEEALPFDEFLREHPCARFTMTAIKEKLEQYLAKRFVDTIEHNPHEYRYDRIKEMIKDIVSRETTFFDHVLTEFTVAIKNYSDVEKAMELNGLLNEEKLLYWLTLDL